jgi:hypothetical protein
MSQRVKTVLYRSFLGSSAFASLAEDTTFFRKWPFSGEDDRGKTSPCALVFTRCDIQSERL